MKRVLYLLRRPPSVAAKETIDLVLVSGVFEQAVSVLFMDDGVFQLVGLGERQSPVKALPTYGVEAIHVAAHSLAERGIALADIAMEVATADRQAVRALIEEHDIVVTD